MPSKLGKIPASSGGVRAHHLRRHELLGPELVVDGLIHLPVHVGEPARNLSARVAASD
jgi:hypothetical protein